MSGGSTASWSEPWSAAMRRRGALATVLLVVVGSDAYIDPGFWLYWPLVEWAGVFELPLFGMLHGLVMALGLLLLGPSSWREVIGTQRSPRWLLAAVGVGLLGAGLSLAGGLFVGGFIPVSVPLHGPMSLQLVEWLYSTLVGPWLAEFLYRGLLWVAIRRFASARATIGVTAALFMLGHGPAMLGGYPFLFVLGILIGWVRERSGSLAVAFFAHSVANAAITGGVLSWVHLLGR